MMYCGGYMMYAMQTWVMSALVVAALLVGIWIGEVVDGSATQVSTFKIVTTVSILCIFQGLSAWHLGLIRYVSPIQGLVWSRIAMPFFATRFTKGEAQLRTRMNNVE